MSRRLKNIEEVARWKKEVVAGNLSSQSIERLKKEGVAKTPQEYAAGLRKGSLNIAKRAGFDINTKPMKFIGGEGFRDALTGLLSGGAYTQSTSKQIRVPENYGMFHKAASILNLNDPLERELVLRHEANEAKYADNSFTNPMPRARIGINNRIVGQHNSMKVISDEATDMNFYNNLFGAAQNLKDFRSRFEDKILQDKLGISYNDINFSNRKKINRIIDKYEKDIPKNLDEKFANILLDPNLSPVQRMKEIKRFFTQPNEEWNTIVDDKDYVKNAFKEIYGRKFKNAYNQFLEKIHSPNSLISSVIDRVFKRR